MGSRARLSLRHALALGALQGPTELLPVSSSAHTTLIPWLAGWPYPELDPELRKSFEVALHAGAAAALAIDMRAELIDSGRGLTGRRIAVIVLSLGAPVLAGYTLERPIERRLGGPRSIVAGLLAGSLAMVIAGCVPLEQPLQRRLSGPSTIAAGLRVEGVAMALAGHCGQCARSAPSGGRRPVRRPRARYRPGRRADPRRVAQRSDAHRGARTGVRARGRPDALLARRPAGHSRSERAEGVAIVARWSPRGSGSSARRGGRQRVPLHSSLPSGCCGEISAAGGTRARCCPTPPTAARSRPSHSYACAGRRIRADDDADPARHRARRPLPPGRADRTRRDVNRLPRVRHRARAAGGDQADASRDRDRLRSARALSARGARGRTAQPPARRQGDRRRRGAIAGERPTAIRATRTAGWGRPT